MKKLSSILFVGIALLAASCNNTKDNAAAPAAAGAENTQAIGNIRYVSQDSILKYYTFAEGISQEIQQIYLAVESYRNQLANQLQNQANQIQQKAQNNGYLNQSTYEADLRDLDSKQRSYENLVNKRAGEADIKAAALQKVLRDSLDNFLKEYNADKNYDAILEIRGNLYVNPALDITQEVIDGLNDRYTVPVEKAKK